MQVNSSIIIGGSIVLGLFYVGTCHLCGQLFKSSAKTTDTYLKYIYFGMGLLVFSNIFEFGSTVSEFVAEAEKLSNLNLSQ